MVNVVPLSSFTNLGLMRGKCVADVIFIVDQEDSGHKQNLSRSQPYCNIHGRDAALTCLRSNYLYGFRRNNDFLRPSVCLPGQRRRAYNSTFFSSTREFDIARLRVRNL